MWTWSAHLREYLVNHPARRDKAVLLNFWLNALLQLLAWFGALLLARPASQPLILHYNIYFGVDFLGPWVWLLVFPVSGLFIFFLNFTLALGLYVHQRLLSLFLVYVATAVQAIFLTALGLIYLINL